MKTAHALRLFLVAANAALVVSACSGDDGGTETTVDATTDETTGTTTGDVMTTTSAGPMTETDPTTTGGATEGTTEGTTAATIEPTTGEPPPECGNEVVEDGEACDDGNDDNTDACLDSCEEPSCGDGYVWADNEECDDGGETDLCDDDCTAPVCGDGTLNASAGEACDDGNNEDGDGCTADCMMETCGDGELQGAEQCDDANDDNTDDCIDTCMAATCGDSYVWLDNEECDDGGESETCNDDCTAAACGDMIVNATAGEECDDGNDDDTDDCPSTCLSPVCGDGFVWTDNEECDDGNNEDGDGCSADCLSEVDAQCNEPYNTLNLADRNVAFNDGNNGIEYCDNQNGDVSPQWQGNAWYRFEGEAGTQMPESAPSIYSCGTDAPGWLNGTHPTPQDGIVDRQVCFNWNANQCNWNSNIQVVNCGSFYLYNLDQPGPCDLRYCGETP